MNGNAADSFLDGRRRISRTDSTLVLIMLLLLARGVIGAEPRNAESELIISKAASAQCATKFREIEEFDRKPNSQKEKTTQFSQDEINSFIALELQSNFSRSLKRLQIRFNEDSLQIDAVVDLDSFGAASARLSEKLLAAVIRGIHSLSATGFLHAKDGKAYFELTEAYVDDHILPKFLVEEIISGVARRQKPPFDPLQPSQMPYHIKSVDLKAGMVIIYQ